MSAEAEDARPLRELDATYPEDPPMVADSLPRGPATSPAGRPNPNRRQKQNWRQNQDD